MKEQRFELAGDPAFGDPASPAMALLPPNAKRGVVGGRDLSMRGEDARLDERLTKLGVEHELFVPADAGHAFLTDGHHPIAGFLLGPLLRVKIDPKNAEAGWERILAFFAQHLGQAEAAH